MKDKILAILEKEAPGIEWSIEDWPHSENTLWLKGQIPITMWGQFIEVDCVLGLDIVLDSDGNIKRKEFYPYIDLTGKGPVYSARLGHAEWIGGVLASVEAQLWAKAGRQA